ncbi:MAG TPA: FadD3 family acyl-CoA ligase [Acidimicrobiales bacterium]|nr:FadD3 family acyl-CoA ligase [Acidimicrobiales bacterium]
MERADLELESIPNAVRVAASRYGADEALVGQHRRWTFAKLEEEMLAAVRAAMAAGIRPGDRAAIWAPNCPEWILAALGILGAGGVLVPVNTRFRGHEAAYVLRKSGASALFVTAPFLGVDYLAMLREADPELAVHRNTIVLDGPPDGGDAQCRSWERFVVEGEAVALDDAAARVASVRAEDVSDIMFTSGTTGMPKGVVLTHGQSLRTYGWLGGQFTFRRGDRYLIVPPFFHTFGYKAGWLACIMFGMAAIPQSVFTPAEVLERIATERVSVLLGPPTLYLDLINHPARRQYDLTSLRVATPSATIVPVELVRQLRGTLGFDVVLTAYGLTEATSVVTSCGPKDDPEDIATSVGRAMDGVEVVVVDDDGHHLPPGSPGEVLVRGFNVTRGYWEDPEATAAVIDAAGWLHTGDIGILDERGYLRIVDRKKDLFIVGGFNVAPAEVEAVLREHPGVAEVAVVGVPDARLGEVGVAFVVPSPDAPAGSIDEAEVVAWARARLANFKVPRRVIVTGQLPKNASMKVLKSELREQAVAVTAPG